MICDAPVLLSRGLHLQKVRTHQGPLRSMPAELPPYEAFQIVTSLVGPGNFLTVAEFPAKARTVIANLGRLAISALGILAYQNRDRLGQMIREGYAR
jgi:hypothetical protein